MEINPKKNIDQKLIRKVKQRDQKKQLLLSQSWRAIDKWGNKINKLNKLLHFRLTNDIFANSVAYPVMCELPITTHSTKTRLNGHFKQDLFYNLSYRCYITKPFKNGEKVLKNKYFFKTLECYLLEDKCDL